ncbi:hypothetical protein CI109_107192 [Kwoniella shandongensis]|uniref:Succinate dehydrogenase assembly factor 2, mitochondrial n=1 Tax=Kwoniella shandongensis TaxID=1734106 RepID=A0A5M6C286_9TREE|nr:uncharacterized protein CI109_002475 [Kwoniella shandongensis]KAA5529134.1 hypothetical protein CI109_002475 [Kwoniella shandongensis]
MTVLRTLPRLARPILSTPGRLSRCSLSTSTRSLKSAAVPDDPYPLPLSNPDLASLASRSTNALSEDSEEWDMPQPLDRTGEDEKTLRARLVYQTRKRGTLETDLILSTFARDELPKMSMEEMLQFDKLLDEPDWDIFYWSVQKREPPPKWKDTALLAKLIKHAKNEGKVVRMMPALMQQEPNL